VTDVAEKYRACVDRLERGRADGTLTEEEDDLLLDEMDDLWYEMTESECREFNNMAKLAAWTTRSTSTPGS
jgi:hypothetical protein